MNANQAAGGIHAIVVGRSMSEYLPRTLHAVARGTVVPDTVTVVVLGDDEPDTSMLDSASIPTTVVRSDAEATGAAYEAGLGENEAKWTWLLHADSSPEETCLAELHRTGEASRAVAALGPKQVGWDDPTELLEVGIRATRSGRRVPELDPGEKDQGQFDTRDDVLAVGTAGMLIRTAALKDAGGFDPVLGPFGDGLELSRRLRAAGHRVVVVPSAVIRHARESFSDTPVSFGRRRGTQIYTAVQRAPLVLAPFLYLWYLILAPIRGLVRLLLKDTVRARGELRGGAMFLRRTGALIQARKRLAAATVTRSYRALEATHRDVVDGRGDIRKAEREAQRLRELPPAHKRKEAADYRARTRSAGFLLALLTLVTGVVAFLPNLSAFGLTGGGLLPDRSNAGDLMRLATQSWMPEGDGSPGYLEPIWILAIPFVYVAGFFGSTLTEVVFLFFLLAPMLAGIAAFRASGIVATSPTVRFFAGAVWALAPPLLSSLSAGQAGGVLFHVVAPLVVLSVVRFAQTPRSSHLGSAAWWVLVAGAAYPAALLFIAALSVILAIAQRRAGWLWLPIPGISLAGPALWFALKDMPGSLFWLPGATMAWKQTDRELVVAGWPLGVNQHPPILIATALILLAALASLLRTRRAGAVRAGWMLAGVGGLLVAIALTQSVGVDLRTFETAIAWPCPGLTLMWLGLMMAITGGAHAIRTDLSQSSLSFKQVLAGICALGVVAMPIVAGATWLTMIHTGDDRHVIADAPSTSTPALSQKNASDPERGRTLVIVPSPEGIVVDLWRGDGQQLSTQSHTMTDGEALGQIMTRLGEDDFAQLAAEHAITVILIPAGSEDSEDLAQTLDATDSVTRVTTSEIGTFWRVDVPSGRVMNNDTVLPSGVIEAEVEAEPGTLYLAERDDPRWVATQNGEELERVEDPWRAAWEVTEAGEVTISHDGGFANTWVILLRLILLVGNVTVSLPWRAR